MCQGNDFVNDIQFNVEILTSGHWPFQDTPVCTIPPQLNSIATKFSQFYVNKFQNRKIMWIYNHGNIVLEPTYLKKKYQLQLNCFQASVLHLFNEFDQLTVAECKQKTQISDKAFSESILRLCNPKSKIISKAKPKVPKLDDPNEMLKLNPDFDSNNIKQNLIPQPALGKIQGEAERNMTQVDNEIQKERAMIIDAVCVRIMKARKVETHIELMNSIVRQITMFNAQPQMIKKRIEGLIEREYLERDKEQRNKYIYKP